MSVVASNLFRRVFSEGIGELSEHLSFRDKLIFSRLDRRLSGETSLIINRIKAGFKKEVDKILKFAEEQFLIPPQQVQKECTALANCVDLKNAGEIKQNIVTKLFCAVVDPLQNHLKISCADLLRQIGLTQFKDEVSHLLEMKEKTEAALELPEKEKKAAIRNVIKELAKHKGLPGMAVIFPLLEARFPQVMDACKQALVEEIIALQRFKEAIGAARVIHNENHLDKIACSLIDLDKIPEAGQIIKRMYRERTKTDQEWKVRFEGLMRSSVVAKIKHLIEAGSSTKAAMLIDSISVEYVQDELRWILDPSFNHQASEVWRGLCSVFHQFRPFSDWEANLNNSH